MLAEQGSAVLVLRGPCGSDCGLGGGVAEESHPEGAPPFDLPAQPAVFAPGPDPAEIAEIAQKLRNAAGLPKEPTGNVANPGNGDGVIGKVKDALT